MLYIGVDLGTSAVKLLLMDESGKVLNIVSKEYPISFPKPGWSEQNPCDWWEQTVAGLMELTEVFDKSSVAGISFGGQMHGLVVLDENDEVIRPAILWNDGRTQKETDYLNNVIGKEKLSELTGNIAFAGFTAPKLLWLKANEPENFAKIKKLTKSFGVLRFIVLIFLFILSFLSFSHYCPYCILFKRNVQRLDFLDFFPLTYSAPSIKKAKEKNSLSLFLNLLK